MEGMAGGLGALGFWLFIAAFPLMGIWDGARKRDLTFEEFRSDGALARVEHKCGLDRGEDWPIDLPG